MLDFARLLPLCFSIALLSASVTSSANDATLNPDINIAKAAHLSHEQAGKLPPPPAACVPAPAGLVSWWRGQTNTIDDWGSNPGTSSPKIPVPPTDVTYAAGKVGTAFSSSFTVEDSASLRVTNGLTIEAWVYLNSTFDFTNHTILSKYAPPSDVSYILGCSNRALYLQLSPSGSLSNSVRVIAPQALPVAAWVHVAGTYDGTALNLYTNGLLASTVNYSQGIHAGFAHVGIGKVATGGSTSTNGFWFWPGLLDEVSLYNRALSTAELQSVVNADGAGKCLSAPTIIEQPMSQAVPQVEDVIFSVNAVGMKPFTFAWTSNGVPIASLPPFLRPQTSRLLIEKIGPRSGIAYAVSVSNSLGRVISSNAILTVLPANSCVQAPLGITDWWPGDTGGSDIVDSLDAQVAPGTATPLSPGKVLNAFSWTDRSFAFGPPWSVLNGSNLNFSATDSFSIEAWIQAPSKEASAGGITLAATESLAILSKNPAAPLGSAGYSLFLDHGRFCCTLRTASSTNTFSSYGPDLRDDMFHHVAITFLRNATNGGVLYVDGQSVVTFDTTPVTGAISNIAALIFFSTLSPFSAGQDSVSLLDEASFYKRALASSEVLAIRNAGAAGKCKTKPIIQVQPANQTVPQGTDVTFSVVALGTPNLRYQWKFKGTNIPGATATSLPVFDAGPSQSGLYSVSITNKLGVTVSHNAILNLIPVAVCSNLVVTADPAACTAAASVDAGSYDPEGFPITTSQVPPGPYPLGVTPVTLIVVDNLGASNSCTATVTVLDKTPPQIVCPTVTAKANDLHQCGAIVQYPLPTVTDSCSAITNLVCVPPSGSFFPLGLTMVNCTAIDAGGNSAECAFGVTVVDSEPPTISCPSDITVTNAHDAWTSSMIFEVPVLDNCPGVRLVVATPPSGSSFALGTNLVSCVSTDAVGNVAHCSFNVIVLPGNHAPTPLITVSPLIHFPGWTNEIVIAPRGTTACVCLDGSGSSDPDGDLFSYQWTDRTNVVSTNVATCVSLGTGAHEITLALDDRFPLGTNSATATIEVITPSDAVLILIGQLQGSDLPAGRLRALLATLNASAAAFQRGNFNAGEHQLGAFEKKVIELMGQSDPDLAESLVATAELIMAIVSADDSTNCNQQLH